MRAVWILLESYLPFRVISWRACDRLERNAFDLGRDYQRGIHDGKLTEDGQVVR